MLRVRASAVMLLAIAGAVVAVPTVAGASWKVPVSGTPRGTAVAGSLQAPAMNTNSCSANSPDKQHATITLTWSAVAKATSYDVYKQTGGNFVLLGNTASSPASDVVPQSSATYTYKVLARVGTNWISPPSGTTSRAISSSGACGAAT